MKTKTANLKTLIKSCQFDYINENIEKLFETEPVRGKIEIKNFGRYMKSEEVIEELKKDGCVPANATELYQWALENKDRFKGEWKYVVALGSVASFEGYRPVPSVWLDGAERGADLGWFGEEGVDRCWFAFSRESLSTESSDTLDVPSVPLALEKEFNRGYIQGLDDAIQALNNLKNI